MAGISCTTSQEFDEMAELEVTLTLPALPGDEEGPTELRARAAVVRCAPLRRGTARRRYELALFFTKLTKESEKILQDFIQRRHAD